MSDQTTYRFTSLFPKHGVDLGTVRTIIEEAGGKPGDYTYTPDGKAYLAEGPAMGLSNLQRVALKYNVEVAVWDGALAADNGMDHALAALGGTNYQVIITMSKDTVQQLLNQGYYLYGFKAVQSTSPDGAPLVWFRTQKFTVTTTVSWSEEYYAYTSTSDIIPDGQIDATFSAPITLNQTLNVEVGGIGEVTDGKVKTAISILNTTSTPFTCGISEMQNGVANPLCAFPLHGNHLDVIAPIEKVLLMFSTDAVNTGTVIEQSYGPGLLIDLTSDNQRTVSYDIDKGWSWGKFGWAHQVPANEDLVPLLIDSTPSFKRRALVLA